MVGYCTAAAAADKPPMTQRDSITIGYQDSAFPFSYGAGADDSHIGYSVDLCDRVVQALVARRGRPIEVRALPVTSRNRIPHLLAGNIDLECGSTSNTPNRAALGVAFSVVIFVSDVAVLARSDLVDSKTHEPIVLTTVTDLQNLSKTAPPVVTTAGSTASRYLREFASRRHAGFIIVNAGNHAESFRMLIDGRASAFVMDRVLLEGWLAWQSQCSTARDSRLHMLEGEVAPDAVEYYGLMMRSADGDLKQIVDATLAELMTSGKIGAIYDRWFRQPVPAGAQFPDCAAASKQLSLDMKMPAALGEFFRRPREPSFAAPASVEGALR